MEELKKKKRELNGLKLEINKVKEKIETLKEKKLVSLLEDKMKLENEIKELKSK